jgi:CheY-like chemotaxis protein
MSASAIHVLLIAAEPLEEFHVPLAELRRAASIFECTTPRGAAEYLREVACPPVLTVLAQSRPGEFVSRELDELARIAPLARIVLLLGSWCEGETRTGQVWPGAARIFWYDWPGELARNLPALAAGRFAPWLAPATTLPEERYLSESFNQRVSATKPREPATVATKAAGPLVLVCTRRSSFGEALCEACRQQGYTALWQRPDRIAAVHGVGAILWEGIHLAPAEVAELAALAAAWPQIPILALADFPRLETQQRAIAAGATALLAKPCVLADLLWHLDRWCPLQSVQSTDQAA